MRRATIYTLTLLAVALSPALSWGHGTPIVVNVVAGQLTVSDGGADNTGYANWVFADPDPESWLLPATPTEQFTELPGFQIFDMNAEEAISLEIISRPDLTAAGQPQRWLWHWDLATEQVAEAPSDPTLEVLSQRGFTPTPFLRQWTAPAVTSVKLADLESDDIGVHRHLLAYFLDDSPAAPAGVYGFFARLVAPGYASSDPFLIALNLNTFDVEQYQEAARQINLAAGLAADFDVDGDVDGSDFLAWQRDLGATGTYPASDGSLNGAVDGDDLAIWKEQFGRIVELPAAPVTAIPEPTGLALAAAAALAAALRRGCRE
jgi:hypothetical protein